MRKSKPVKTNPTYRIVQRGDKFAVYDKHSKFRVICDSAADAQSYIDQQTARPRQAALAAADA